MNKILFSAFLFFQSFVGAFAANPYEIRVAAAADLTFIMNELVSGYNLKHPDQKVSVVIGASGNLVSQIQQGAAFDLFFSADTKYTDTLAKTIKGGGEKFTYAIGHLVLWVPNDSKIPIQKGLSVLTSPEVKKIAIANPSHAPYGRAAEAALKKAEIYDQVSSKLVQGENIAQAAQFVEAHAADIGIIAASLAYAPTLQKEGHFVEIKPSLYPAIVQSGLILKSSDHLKEARSFRDFVLSAEAKKILTRFGMTTP